MGQAQTQDGQQNRRSGKNEYVFFNLDLFCKEQQQDLSAIFLADSSLSDGGYPVRTILDPIISANHQRRELTLFSHLFLYSIRTSCFQSLVRIEVQGSSLVHHERNPVLDGRLVQTVTRLLSPLGLVRTRRACLGPSIC